MCQESTLWLGHNVSRILFEKSKDHFQSPEGFANGIKVCISKYIKIYQNISCFRVTALTISVRIYGSFFRQSIIRTALESRSCKDPPIRSMRGDPKHSLLPQVSIELHKYLRSLPHNSPTIVRHVHGLLDDGEAEKTRILLEDDEFLAQHAKANLRSGQEKVSSMLHSIESLVTVLRFLKIPKTPMFSELIIQALAGELLSSKIVEDVLAAIKKSPSNTIESLLGALPVRMGELDAFRELQETLQSLLRNKRSPEPLRSEYDECHSTHKTTVVGQRVKLTKGKAKLSKQDIEYTTFVNDLSAAFRDYFSSNLTSPQDLFMHEAFLYDLRTPIKDAFTPRPRFTIERALSAPFDYLIAGTNSADDENATPSKPAISILYNLYLETGSLVNVYDLWRAYLTMAGGEDGEEYDERQALTLFYRALSELKMMGMVKHSKKKIDHLAKSAWMGL